MKRFIEKHEDKINGAISCFDRILFKGYLPLGFPEAMEAFMNQQSLLLKEFKTFVKKQSEIIKQHGISIADKAQRPYIYLNRPIRKEERAREIAEEGEITEGLICVFGILEQCQSFKLAYGNNKPRLVNANPRCLCLYFYYIDRDLGFIHVRIQTWFPFAIQIYINGHDWLAQKLDKHGITYTKVENAFVCIDNPERAQHFANKMVKQNWPRILNVFAGRVNCHLNGMLHGMDYYWVIDQAEYATDIMFKDRASLKNLYEKLLMHTTMCFSAEDVMTFLGRKLNGNFRGEILNTFNKRWPGARVKHRMKGNWMKMYDKHGCVLRVETVINHPYEFKVRRKGIRKGEIVTDWFPMAKGVSNFYRYAEVSLAANKRYLEALSVVDDPTHCYQMLNRLCEPTNRNRQRRRGFNPLRQCDVTLFAAVLRGEHFIHGFRNRDLSLHLGIKISKNPEEKKRQSAYVTRLIQLLRAHGLIAKFPRSRRYRITLYGLRLMSAAVTLHKKDFPSTMVQRLAA